MNDEVTTKNDEVKAEVVEKEKYLRLAADFENYKRTMEAQLSETAKFGGQPVVLKMVDVMDHLDRAMTHAPPDLLKSDWFKGLVQVWHQFHDAMKMVGVQWIDATGKTYDPATMEAIAVVGGGESQIVKEEVRAGFTMHGRVIRPARVIIYQ